LQSGGAQRGAAETLCGAALLGKCCAASPRPPSHPRPLHSAPLVPRAGFFSACLLLSIPHASSCGAMDGLRRAARLRVVAPVLANDLSLPASLLALAAAPLRINFFSLPHHPRLGSAA